MSLDSGEEVFNQNYGLSKIHNFSAFVVELGEVWLAVNVRDIFGHLKQADTKGRRISQRQTDDPSVVKQSMPPCPFDLDLHSVLFLHDDVLGMD